MEHSFRSILILLAGIASLATAAAIHAILLERSAWSTLLGVIGIVLSAWGAYRLRAELGSLLQQRRGEIALYTLGVVGVLVALAYLSVRFPYRVDMTSVGKFSLSPQTVTMLQRLEKPVHITFFNDPMMRDTVEIYELMAAKSKGKVTVEFHDPMLNPAMARMRGVEFAGVAIMESEGRSFRVNGPTETEIANGILRVSQGAQQLVCFLDGHGEPDPFSLESHDHSEGSAGHSHGIGSKMVLHERHGMAKARQGLEAMNYVVKKVSLSSGETLSQCALLVIAGPKSPLLAPEVKAIDEYLAKGGNAFFMLDPFITTGLEGIVREFGIIVEDDIVIDPAKHFWTDVSAPAVTDYNRHEVTRDLPLTFFPGARSLSPTPERIPGVSARPMINSSKDSFGGTNPDRPEFNPEKDKTGPLTLMVFANRRPEFVSSTEAVIRELRGEPAAMEEAKKAKEKASVASRVAVVGDSDFATNSFFHIMGNGKLFLNTVNYLASRENLIGIEPRTYDQPRVNLTNTQMKGTFFLSIVLIPALMAVIGFAVWWRQR